MLDIRPTRFQISEYFSNRFALKLSTRVEHCKGIQWSTLSGFYKADNDNSHWVSILICSGVHKSWEKSAVYLQGKKRWIPTPWCEKQDTNFILKVLWCLFQGFTCTVSVSVGDTWIQLLLILTSQFNKSAFAFNQQGHWLSPTKSLPISTSWSAAGNLPLNRQWTPGSSALPQSCLWLKVFNIRFLVTYSYNISLIYLIPFELGGCYFWRLHFTDFIAGHKTWNT